jgi:hypothetical protein
LRPYALVIRGGVVGKLNLKIEREFQYLYQRVEKYDSIDIDSQDL